MAEQGSVYGAHGSDGGAAAGRVSYLLGLKGPCFSVNTACSSSLVALDAAYQNLQLHTCNRCVVAGVCLHMHATSFGAFCALHALSPDGQCKTFDGKADGYGRSEAVGAVNLARTSGSMLKLCGTSVNQDGRSASFMGPNGLSQQAVVRAAMQVQYRRESASEFSGGKSFSRCFRYLHCAFLCFCSFLTEKARSVLFSSNQPGGLWS